MIYQTLGLSDHWFPRMLRWGRRAVLNFVLPSPHLLSVPLRSMFVAVRSMYYFIARVFFCEPFFRSYCSRYGRNVHTGVFFHWVEGRGELIVGDNVTIDGKCSFCFAARYSARPTLIIGDNTGIGHGCGFAIGKQITIGRYCRIAGSVQILDAPGHPADPIARQAGLPATNDEVRPVVIEDNVWIGNRAIIMPGVTVGRGSIVTAGSVVMTNVPPDTMVAGNPARLVRALAKTVLGEPPAKQRASISSLTNTPTDILSEVTDIIAEIGNVKGLVPDQDFYAAGITSIMVLPLLLEMEERFHVSIPDEVFIAARSPRAIAEIIANVRGK